jgi:uncharacterized protein (TIGR02284 family)
MSRLPDGPALRGAEDGFGTLPKEFAMSAEDREDRDLGAAGVAGRIQSAGPNDGDRSDVVHVLTELAEVCHDGEFGFRECAEQARRPDLKQVFLARADDCRTAAQQLNELIQQCGGAPERGGSTLGAIHRGWVAVKAKLSTYDDVAVLEECERGEDNAKARYQKALDKPLPPHVRQVVERQLQGVMRNHDEIKRLRDAAA